METYIKKVLIMVLLAVFTFTGCSNKKDKDNKGIIDDSIMEKYEDGEFETDKDYFSYNINTDIFTVDDSGNVYAVNTEPVQNDTEQDENEDAAITFLHKIACYDLNGELIKEYNETAGCGSARTVSYDNGKLYMSVPEANGMSNIEGVYSLDIESGEFKKIAAYEAITRISYMVADNGMIYCIGINSELIDKEYDECDEAPYYSYGGQCFFRFPAEGGDMEILDIEFPITCQGTGNGVIAVYAYNEQEGYQIIKYYTKENKAVTICNKNLGDDAAICMYNAEAIFCNNTVSYGGISCLDLNDVNKEAQLIEGKTTKHYYYKNGILFYYNWGNKSVEYIKVSSYLKNNVTINYILSDSGLELPYGCGYNMNTARLDTEAFALKVLAGDKDYDLCLMHSSQETADNIRKNNMFYKLNDVEGVNEYINACFPAIKEAALDENGDIWMLPVSIAIPSVIYNKEQCEKDGVVINDGMTLMEFEQMVEEAALKKPSYVDLPRDIILEELFSQYFYEYDSADTEFFRNAAQVFYKHYNENEERGWQTEALNTLRRRGESDFYYINEKYRADFILDASYIGENSNYGIKSLPNIDGNGNPAAYCVFLAVNPESAQLDETLSYISDLCKYLMEKKDMFLLKDKSMYTDNYFINDLYEAHMNMNIIFNIPDDIYMYDFNNYIDGETDLETMIMEIDRKYKTYLTE